MQKALRVGGVWLPPVALSADYEWTTLGLSVLLHRGLRLPSGRHLHDGLLPALGKCPDAVTGDRVASILPAVKYQYFRSLSD